MFSSKKESSLDRVLGRIDSLDAVNLANLAQKLARERAMLETVFNTALEGILVIDREGVVHYANASGRRLIGVKDSDVGSITIWRLIPGLKASLGVRDSIELDRSTSAREFELTYPERRFVRLYILPFAEEDAEVGESGGRFVVMLSDITLEKLSVDETIESERISSILLLAAGVAHELGNPLNSVTIHLQLMERQIAKLKRSTEKERIAKSVSVCRGEVERLDGVIRNFLEAIRPQEPDFQVLNLNDSLEEVLEFYGNELGDRGVDVDVEIGNELPIARADRQQMKQAFFNVIKNAVEAMPPGGTIQVKFSQDEETIYMRIGDSGSGIKQDDLAKVFMPYHTTKTSGTGLGLMIVQRIMREHGGQIGIDSREGVGTVVTLEFPKQNRKFRMLEGKS